MGEFGQIANADERPDDASVALDRLPHRGEQISRKYTLADLGVDLLELIDR